MARANLGVLKPDAINVAVHGTIRLLSEVIVAQAMALKDEAIAAGAPAGFTLSASAAPDEVMMRHGIPTATNSLSQELAIATGALDAAVVDYQCIMPSLPWAAKKFHTAVITTMSIARCRARSTSSLMRSTQVRKRRDSAHRD